MPEKHLIAPQGACAAGHMQNVVRERGSAEGVAETFDNIYDGGLGGDEISRELAPPNSNSWAQHCTVCLGNALLVGGELAIPPKECVDSLSCEVSWTTLYPEAYLEDGKPDTSEIPCAGSRCDAQLKLSCHAGGLVAKIVQGRCTVDKENERYQIEGQALLDGMELTDPSRGIVDDSQIVRPVPGLVEREPGDPRTPEPPLHRDWHAL